MHKSVSHSPWGESSGFSLIRHANSGKLPLKVLPEGIVFPSSPVDRLFVESIQWMRLSNAETRRGRALHKPKFYTSYSLQINTF
ncbi:hypothetical protein CEXT_624751 [Caerostris extrusa]|uniref:Ycf15 n=1 Tax=Caerostris extrusa TaxID=172846 RepID=A0AAV4TR90_CAEEX|nr:hypothetical protein CEXT_624751 [Caerostris extrusa]